MHDVVLGHARPYAIIVAVEEQVDPIHPSLPALPRQEGVEQIKTITAEHIPGKRRLLLKSATFVMLGNLASSVMGLLRQSVVASLGPGIAAPFQAALTPLQTFLDLLANGTVSGALIPTFTDYAEGERRQELRRVVYSIVNLLILVTFTIAVVFFFVAPPFVQSLLGKNFGASQRALTVQLSQVVMFALIIMGPFAVLQAALYSRQKFGGAALAAGFLHVGVIAGAIATSLWSATRFGQLGLAFGVILGALVQIALLIPGLRRQNLPYMLVLDLRHPAIRRIFKLYAPLAPSYIVSMLFVFIDLGLQSRTPGNSAANVAALRFATTLVQFPVGLVAAALSFAVLPLLSTYATNKDEDQFKETLMMGIRLGLLLMIPSAAGLIALRTPITSLLFEHRHYTAQDAGLTAMVLQNYAYQLPFVVVDQLVMFAFYARKNTLVPVLVGFVCYGFYALVAFPFYRTIGAPALAFANTAQNSMHGLILLALFYKFFGSLSLRQTLPAILKIMIATAAMVAVVWALQTMMSGYALFSLRTLRGQIATTLIAGGGAVVVYFGAISLLKVEEIALLRGAVLAKMGRR